MTEPAYNQIQGPAYESVEPITGIRFKGPAVLHPKTLAMGREITAYSLTDYRLINGSEADISDQLSNL